MARLKTLTIPGMQLWFPSNDHDPAHFHIKRNGEWVFRVYFLRCAEEMFELVWSAKKKQMSKGDRELLQQLVDEHRSEIFKEWEQKANQ